MKSPSIDICVFDARTGCCKGCGRTNDEIRAWKKIQPHRQRGIASDLSRRLAKIDPAAKAMRPGR